MIEPYRKHREQNIDKNECENSLIEYNNRYIRTFKSIVGARFKSGILDLGCGTDHFSKACRLQGYEAEGIDTDKCNLETDPLLYEQETFNVITMLAVIEHLKNPHNAMSEIHRILKPSGILILRTPNWQMDFKNFYNDPTHVKPYTPSGLKTMLEMYGFRTIFLEPGLICKSKLYWRLPSFMKWQIAKLTRGGSKSILAIGEKI